MLLFLTPGLSRNPWAGRRPKSYSSASWHGLLRREREEENHAANWHNYVNNPGPHLDGKVHGFCLDVWGGDLTAVTKQPLHKLCLRYTADKNISA